MDNIFDKLQPWKEWLIQAYKSMPVFPQPPSIQDQDDIDIGLNSDFSTKHLITVGKLEMDDVFDNITTDKRMLRIFSAENGKKYLIRYTDKLQVLAKNRVCSCCGLKGTVALLQVDKNETSWVKDYAQINIYGVVNGNYILLTQDHIKPKSKGGSDSKTNLQTMCELCNRNKGHLKLSMDELKSRVQLWRKIINSEEKEKCTIK